MNVRCVVTGQKESGKSVFVRDAPVEPITLSLLPGFEFHRLWGSESVPKLPSDGTAPPHPRYFPPKGGFRFGLFTVPPETRETGLNNLGPALAELQQKLPGMVEALELDNPGMHTTDTVDFDVILSGEVYLELDDGAEVLLKAGDCVVQNGTRHAWRNRSSENCVIAVTLVGAERGR
ncbi:MAG TPA: cupin domain-containing protein [Terriglobales bacterium]|nr:cupin domain-containing protein [Terriglobales bacterium]